MSVDRNSVFEAALPKSYRVLGLPLHPFSLGHYLILKRHGCGFVSDEQTNATYEDLIFGVLVCSQSLDEFSRWIAKGTLSRWEEANELLRFLCFRSSVNELAIAFQGTRPQLDVARWGRMCGLFEFSKAATLFKEYLDEHSVQPAFWIERESKHESGAHWAEGLLVTLVDIGFSKDEALNMSLREAFLHFYKYAEHEGAVRLMTKEELEEN